jgi:hypothetical protein
MQTLTLSIPVRNLGRKSISSTWTVTQVGRKELGDDPVIDALPRENFQIGDFGFVDIDPNVLAPRDALSPEASVTWKLAPNSERVLTLLIDRPDPSLKPAGAVVLLSVREERRGKSAGGFVVAVTDTGNLKVALPDVVLAPRPLPLTLLAGPVQTSGPIHDGKARVSALDASMPDSHLGAVFRNDSGAALTSMVLYSECLSMPGVHWTPRCYETARLEPGEEVFVAVPADISQAGIAFGSLRWVGYADGFDRTRFDIKVATAPDSGRR